MIHPITDHGFHYTSTIPEVVEDVISVGHEPTSPDKQSLQSPTSLFEAFSPQSHTHNGSTSTSASESAGSSPTTTVSIADDSSATEISPGSSPESPMSKPTMISTTINVEPSQPLAPGDPSETRPLQQPVSFFEMQRPPTPGKRPRNLKNLAVKTTGAASATRGAATSLPKVGSQAADNSTQSQPPPTAAFQRPASPPKRRPSNLSLTLVTPSVQDSFSFAPSAVIPPTPSVARPNTLRHFQSSPALPQIGPRRSLRSPPVLTNLSRPVFERTQSETPIRTPTEDLTYELPQSREEKLEAYPDGPICIFDPYIDLFLEPTAEQAAKYDVVINVASEVRNPFVTYSTPDPTKDSIRIDGGGGLQLPPPTTRSVTTSGDSIASGASMDSTTPTTPKATPEHDTFPKIPTPGSKTPEYIHMPWEHNTDIVRDLLTLVKLIDERVKQRKRILIHCQCGVSRSATLCVAYCLYLNPRQSVQQAYDIVKARSKWIGPNMNLIMQLQEFSSTIAGAAIAGARRGPALRSLTPIESSGSWNAWRRSEPGPSTRLNPDEPRTAPLPPQTPTASTADADITAITPGPSSAPSGLVWSDTAAAKSDVASNSVSATPRTAINSTQPSQRLQAIRTDMSLAVPTTSNTLVSPRSEHFAMSRLQPSVDIAADDTFGIMSPTTSSFSHGPLNRDALLSSLGMGSAVRDNSHRQTQNFSFPLRKPLNAPTALQVATGAFTVLNNGTLPSSQTLVVPSPSVNSLLDPLMSPRAASFTVNPFTGKPAPIMSARYTDDDPRSPAQKGSNPIVRNIADMI